MPFLTDQQTFNDLHLFGRRGADSVYGLFDRTATRHGALLLEEVFRYPLSDADAINSRSELFNCFATIGGGFPFQADLFDIAEQYLSVTDERTRLAGEEQTLVRRLAGLVAEDNEYKTLYKGVTASVRIVQDLHRFLMSVPGSSPYQGEKMAILTIFSADELRAMLTEGTKIPYDRVVVYDSYLRFRNRDTMRRLLQAVYQLDVYFSVGATAVKRGFVFPRALPGAERRMDLTGIYHPLVEKAVPNTIGITAENHILFLTGANMAGKSTFMKTMGIALYLAHMGFPVPAERLEFSVLDGIFTTINLPDDLGMGVSHFYAEVQRIKKIAQHLHQGKRLFVIFDEIFRGTNVKDAYEATIALTRAFGGRKDSVLLLSTHIIEAGEVLAGKASGIDFIFLPTRMEGSRPVYSYRLEKGISSDRHGMVIIGNEGIFEILKKGEEGVVKGGRETAGPARRVGDAETAGRVKPEETAVFSADSQTLEDLNLTGKYKPGSIYSLFNKVETEGAEQLLEEMFRQPLSDHLAINRRSNQFIYFQSRALHFPFTRMQLRQVEDYLRSGSPGNRLATSAAVLRMHLMATTVKDERYEQLRVAVAAVIEVVRTGRAWLGKLQEEGYGPIRMLVENARVLLDDSRLGGLAERSSGLAEPLGWQELAKYHYLFGTVLAEPLHQFCAALYELDLGITVGRVAQERGLGYAIALPKEEGVLNIVDLRHPGIGRAVGNSLTMTRESNMIFLTGANMAGKSTLMKSFGIAVYLAHMGFPVAATEMAFSVRDGLYTSINVPDDLNRGHSHFYAETLRVKDAATAISAGKQLVVIFDELFKGTNVKDAYDATLAVTSAFAAYRNCLFIISTHIIEVGETLRKRGNLQFAYLPTVMEGPVPRYTYRLEAGITSDRHGMRIIENEGILELF